MFASSINSQLFFFVFVLIWNRQLGGTSELVFIVPSTHGTMGLQGRSTESLWKWDHGFTCFNQPTTQPTNQSTSINQSSTFHSLQLFGSSMRLATPAPSTALQRHLRRSCSPSASIGALIFLAGLGVRRFSSVTSREHWMPAPFDGRPQVERAKTSWKKMAYGLKHGGRWHPKFEVAEGVRVSMRFAKKMGRPNLDLYILYWFYVGQRILQRRPKCYSSVLQL